MYGGVKVIIYSFLTWQQFDMNHPPLRRPLKAGKDFFPINDQTYMALQTFDSTDFMSTLSNKLRIW
jgi:hypothetical protein